MCVLMSAMASTFLQRENCIRDRDYIKINSYTHLTSNSKDSGSGQSCSRPTNLLRSRDRLRFGLGGLSKSVWNVDKSTKKIIYYYLISNRGTTLHLQSIRLRIAFHASAGDALAMFILLLDTGVVGSTLELLTPPPLLRAS